VQSETPAFKTVANPYVDGPFADPEDAGAELFAMPALRLDVAAIHVNVADTAGSAMVLGPDAHFDDLFLGAATRRFVTAEQVVPAGTLADHGPLERAMIHRLLTDKVAETPGGAHFTANPPDAQRDEAFQKHYAASAKDSETWAAFKERFLAGDEAAYQSAVETWRSEQ
jgi:glutaconate CoA-transferase subunit A